MSNHKTPEHRCQNKDFATQLKTNLLPEELQTAQTRILDNRKNGGGRLIIAKTEEGLEIPISWESSITYGSTVVEQLGIFPSGYKNAQQIAKTTLEMLTNYTQYDEQSLLRMTFHKAMHS